MNRLLFFSVAFLATLSAVYGNAWQTWILSALYFLSVGAIGLQGARKIPANPPHRAVVTRLGRRTNKVKKEGWRFFLFYPYWNGYILVNVTKVNYDLPPQSVRTPDVAELEIPISLTWTPLDKEVDSCDTETRVNGLINYLNAGGEKGVKEILDDIVRERLREWAISKVEGPKTWEQALGAREEAIDVLMKSIARGVVDSIESNIPTGLLLRFFNFSAKEFTHKGMTPFEEDPKVSPCADEEEDNGEKEDLKDWQRLKELYLRLSDQQRAELKERVVKRKEQIARLRQGNGGIELPQLGIRLDRLNIDEIKPKGKLAESAEKMVMEKRETKGDQIRINNVKKRIRELTQLDFSPEQALEIVQTERGKVTKDISEGKLNLSVETRKMIEKLLSDLFKNLFGKR